MNRLSLTTASILSLSALLAGCGGLLGSREPAPVTYVLRPVIASPGAQGAATADPRAPSLQVQRVVVAPGYARDEILRTEPDRRLEQYAASRWPDALPAVVERLAVDALRQHAAWSAVHDAAAPLAATHLLRLTVRRFDAEYAVVGRAPTVRVVIDATVARRSDRALLAAFTVEASAAASEDRMSAIVAAFERAVGQAMADIARGAAGAGAASALASSGNAG
jgi:cholesterol transport system auxiliary component